MLFSERPPKSELDVLQKLVNGPERRIRDYESGLLVLTLPCKRVRRVTFNSLLTKRYVRLEKRIRVGSKKVLGRRNGRLRRYVRGIFEKVYCITALGKRAAALRKQIHDHRTRPRP